MTLPTKGEIERQLVMERAILATLEGGYQDKGGSLVRHYQPAPGEAWRHDTLPGHEFYPVFPHWKDTVRMRIGALTLMLETGNYAPSIRVVNKPVRGRRIDV